MSIIIKNIKNTNKIVINEVEYFDFENFNTSPTILQYINSIHKSDIYNESINPINIDNIIIDNTPFEEVTAKSLNDKIIDEQIPKDDRNEFKNDVPKNIKPMEKPVKQVFKKKKNILWYLGIKK